MVPHEIPKKGDRHEAEVKNQERFRRPVKRIENHARIMAHNRRQSSRNLGSAIQRSVSMTRNFGGFRKRARVAGQKVSGGGPKKVS